MMADFVTGLQRYLNTIRLLMFIGLVLTLLSATPVYGQTTYSDMWAEQLPDLSVLMWGTGVTDDTQLHAYMHQVDSSPQLTGPNGMSSRYQTDFGYIRSEASLGAVEGDYHTYTSHFIMCAGSRQSSSPVQTVSIHDYIYYLISSGSWFCKYHRCT